jgi:hypothetical protein
MTDLQDRILDRLVGTRVGVNWPDGPLAIAGEVASGLPPVKFGLTDNDRGAKAEVARRLGYPVILCEAIQGATRGLKAEDDRRSLGMALFATIPVGGPVPRLSSDAQNRIAVRLAIRAHPYVCERPGCPVLAALTRLVEAPTPTRQMNAEALRGLKERKSVYGWCSVRESARLAAAARGLAEAVDCCQEIARRCGMAV